ncbi:MAG: hypothetical protein KTV45_15815 [Acidimicrobiia bacterium]|nr:hypothetical protein [Acidimicrobiia bacterium]
MTVSFVRRFACLLVVLAFASLLAPVGPAAAQTVTVGNVDNLVVEENDSSLRLRFKLPTTGYEEICFRWREKDAKPDEAGDQPGSWMPTDDGECRNAGSFTSGFPGNYVIHGLTNDTTYEVEVSAKDKDDVSSGWTVRAEGTPTPDVYLTTSSETVAEGESVTITAVLNEAAGPGGVEVRFRRGPGSDSSLTDSDFMVAPMTFRIGEGETTGTATLSATDDEIDEADEELLVLVGQLRGGLNQFLEPGRVSIKLADNDEAGVQVTPTELTIPADGYTTYSVVLDTPPINRVLIDLSVSDSGKATVEPSSVAFDDGDWQVPKTVTVLGVAEATEPVTISHRVLSRDAQYNGLTADSVMLSVVKAGEALVSNTAQNPAGGRYYRPYGHRSRCGPGLHHGRPRRLCALEHRLETGSAGTVDRRPG